MELSFNCTCGKMLREHKADVNGKADLSINCESCGRKYILTLTELQSLEQDL